MAAEHTTVGVHHLTVVPGTPTETGETDGHPIRCPACGRPLAGH